ncbi:ABC transporter ATP-binding protein [Coleofasciculus sp. E1-EBD-02]|uniref:ABC transporter ATP-binding protein n=1 Tax=Coleofasciculus sp. E1-EBD-02 TaxID=3068481 RepID=UPI0032F1504A
MSDTVIQVENLSKKYIIGHQQQERYTALRDVMANGAKSLGQRLLKPWGKQSANPAYEEFWALKDVSFEVKQGDRIGIIGRNGAGKSTLLKILSRITEPTTGRIRIKGRVASLLEVGTGFHPELTGRENIFLNGAILGMSKAEIRRKFDEIVDFAGIEKFLDTPVKRYSSGMYVRLAFAVAAHLEPEILIVDEVLAVGDAQFQKKCLGKMDEVGREGRTVLFVSHNMGTLKALCHSAILFCQGRILHQGITSQVVDSYLLYASGNRVSNGEMQWFDRQQAPGGKEVRLVAIRLLNPDNVVQRNFDAGKAIQVEIVYEIFESVRGMRLVVQILSNDGSIAFCSTDYAIRNTETTPGLYRTVCTIPACLLNSGLHFVKVHAGCPGVKILVECNFLLDFFVEKINHHGPLFSEKWPGVVAPKLDWQTYSI